MASRPKPMEVLTDMSVVRVRFAGVLVRYGRLQGWLPISQIRVPGARTDVEKKARLVWARDHGDPIDVELPRWLMGRVDWQQVRLRRP